MLNNKNKLKTATSMIENWILLFLFWACVIKSALK